MTPSNLPEEKPVKAEIRKTRSHGRIGEAATTAKCWMNGIPAHNTAGLRANFAGSDLIVDTVDPRKKLLIQVKTGYCGSNCQIYLTQCSSEAELTQDKFVADFVVFVNLDRKAGENHQHDGTLRFEHLTFYVVPRDIANAAYRAAVNREYDRPKKTGERRKLSNLAVYIPPAQFEDYREAWHLIKIPNMNQEKLITPPPASPA